MHSSTVPNHHRERRNLAWHLATITRQSYTTLFLAWIALTATFALAYFLLSHFAPEHAPGAFAQMHPLQAFLNSLYYSIITATSTGYGDIFPQGFSKVLASIQTISSLMVFAIFVTKLVSSQQEIALQEVHKLTFEDIFHNAREDLFIIRRDLDGIIDDARRHGKLSEEAWENLFIAFKQAQTLLQEIPDFYNGGNTFYTIDARREQLLLEAVHRTLHRINKALDVLSRAQIDWSGHPQCMKDLKELMRIFDSITPLWQERSPYKKKEAFADILDMKRQMHERIGTSLPI
ncbi:MAG: potassium channel family protein [Candidatus Peribacteraceae bacterium]|nr:potassium channel family protein [Candidatus Peribacteraceae bacterium]